MSYFYSNLAQKDTTNTKKTNESKKCYNAMKKPKKGSKSPILKKAIIAGD
jgi:hypothetical protein